MSPGVAARRGGSGPGRVRLAAQLGPDVVRFDPRRDPGRGEAENEGQRGGGEQRRGSSKGFARGFYLDPARSGRDRAAAAFGKAKVRAGLLTLRVAQAGDLPADLLDPMTGGTLAGSGFERHFLRYIVERMNLTPPMLEASLRRTKPDRWETLMGTVVEAWLERGRAEGIGKGQAGLRLRQLELRFGELPEAVRDRVRGASVPELEAWAEAVLVAASVDEVLASAPGR